MTPCYCARTDMVGKTKKERMIGVEWFERTVGDNEEWGRGTMAMSGRDWRRSSLSKYELARLAVAVIGVIFLGAALFILWLMGIVPWPIGIVGAIMYFIPAMILWSR